MFGKLFALVPYPTMQYQISASAPAFCTHCCSLKDTRTLTQKVTRDSG